MTTPDYWRALSSVQKLEAVRKHADGKRSAGEIAQILGVSRNAVIGVVHRHRGKIELSSGRPIRKRRPAPPRPKRSPIPDRKIKLPPLDNGYVERLERQPAWRPLPNTNPTPLLARTGCAWPVLVDGKTLFCNCAVPEEHRVPYCEEHMKVYRRPRDE